MEELGVYIDESELATILQALDQLEQQQQQPQPQPQPQQQQQEQLENQQLQQMQNFFQQQPQQQPQLFPRIVIVEQPAIAVRFRYELECESRKSASSIPGRNSTPENKTLPTIRVIDYVGPAVVVVSLVTENSDNGKYRTHPHNLVGNNCKKEEGVCRFKIIITDNMDVPFPNLGIQCIKKNEIKTSLEKRKEIRVDPFKAGFSHANRPIELNVVRLCFELYLPNEEGEIKFRLEPIVSEPIYDEKTLSSLRICRVEPCCASAAGGKTVVLFCEKVLNNDIEVRFFEKKNNVIIWDKNAVFTQIDVHKKVAIALKTPAYDLKPVNKPVKVFIQLRRLFDGALGETRQFEIIPIGADDPDYLKRKRTRYSNDPTTNHLQRLQNPNENTESLGQNQPGCSTWNQPGSSTLNQPGCSTSTEAPSRLEATTISPNQAPNPNRVILSPRRTPSPMEPMDSNMSPQYHQQVEHSSIQQQFLHPNTGLNQQLPDLLTINSPTQQNNIPHVEPQENTNQLPNSSSNIDVDDLLIDNLSATSLASLSISGDINEAVDAAHQDETND